MQVKDVMTGTCEFVEPNTSLREAAKKMRDLDCGFLPIGSESVGKLEGTVTDRDITIRAVAEGRDPVTTTVKDIETHKVLYCFETDDLDSAAKSMREQQVYRLVVLDNPDDKRLRGVLSLGDVLRHNQQQLAADTASGIVSRAA